MVHEVLLQEQDEVLFGPAESYAIFMAIGQNKLDMRVMLIMCQEIEKKNVFC